MYHQYITCILSRLSLKLIKNQKPFQPLEGPHTVQLLPIWCLFPQLLHLGRSEQPVYIITED